VRSDGRDLRRNYLMSRVERARRHIRTYFVRALVAGTSGSALVAGFVSASGETWPLLGYIGLAAGLTCVVLGGQAMTTPRYKYLPIIPGTSRGRKILGRPPQLPLRADALRSPTKQVDAARCDDPVYFAGLRALIGPSCPIVVVPSNRRDVSKPHEVLFPLFSSAGTRSRVTVDLTKFGIPIKEYSFERELPEGVQDADHTLAIKDLIYTPNLAATLAMRDGPVTDPLLWPEHCVDPALLSRHDVVVVGGPDTNFWHAALFEPVFRTFNEPPSSVPLALNLRRDNGTYPSYGSRSLAVRLEGLGEVLPHTREEYVELDERLYPTYGMILACRNPFAAAVGLSRWCVFIAGTRSLGTSGGVLALTMLFDQMNRSSGCNFSSLVRTTAPDVHASASAILYRVSEVERAMIAREGTIHSRQRNSMAPASVFHRG